MQFENWTVVKEQTWEDQAEGTAVVQAGGADGSGREADKRAAPRNLLVDSMGYGDGASKFWAQCSAHISYSKKL